MHRPFLKTAIAELEAEFDSRRSDPAFLQALLDELSHRSNRRAADLRTRALQALGTATKTERAGVAPASAPVLLFAGLPAKRSERASAPKNEMPPVTNDPTSILAAWTALEVLSPPSFRRPEDLAGGDRSAVASLDHDRLPWVSSSQGGRKNMRLYYQVVLGTIDLEAAFARLISVFGDARIERPAARGRAVLAVILVDREGRVVEDSAVALSSFGWGVPRAATSANLEALAEWPLAEPVLANRLAKLVRREDEDGRQLPLDVDRIRQAFDWLVSALELPEELVEPP
jgi:hypothetical protein